MILCDYDEPSGWRYHWNGVQTGRADDQVSSAETKLWVFNSQEHSALPNFWKYNINFVFFVRCLLMRNQGLGEQKRQQGAIMQVYLQYIFNYITSIRAIDQPNLSTLVSTPFIWWNSWDPQLSNSLAPPLSWFDKRFFCGATRFCATTSISSTIQCKHA